MRYCGERDGEIWMAIINDRVDGVDDVARVARGLCGPLTRFWLQRYCISLGSAAIYLHPAAPPLSVLPAADLLQQSYERFQESRSQRLSVDSGLLRPKGAVY